MSAVGKKSRLKCHINNNNGNLYSATIRHIVALVELLHIKHHVKTILLMPIKRPILNPKNNIITIK